MTALPQAEQPPAGLTSSTTPAVGPPPGVHPVRAAHLRSLVTQQLSLDELRAIHAAGRSGLPSSSWDGLVSTISASAERVKPQVLLVGPTKLCAVLGPVVSPIAETVTVWDGRQPPPQTDIAVTALPWRLDSLHDLAEAARRAGSEHLPRQIIPISLNGDSVTVGPTISNAGPCLSCVQPALAQTTAPESADEAILTALAVGAVGLFLRSNGARVHGGALSLTFTAQAPTVVHRLWTCTPSCARVGVAAVP